VLPLTTGAGGYLAAFSAIVLEQVVSGIIGKSADDRDGTDRAVILLPGSLGVLSATVIKGERSRGDYMVGSHLAALVLEGVHSLCSPSVTVFAEFQQSFARVLAEFYFQLFSGEAVFAPGIPRNKSLDSGGVFDG